MFTQNSFNALNSSSSHLSLIRNSSKINIVLSSIIFLQFSKAHRVEEYKSASKFIIEANGLFFKKYSGKVSLKLPAINFPPFIFGITPSLEYVPTFSLYQFSGKPVKVSNPKPFFILFIIYSNETPFQTPNS